MLIVPPAHHSGSGVHFTLWQVSLGTKPAYNYWEEAIQTLGATLQTFKTISDILRTLVIFNRVWISDVNIQPFLLRWMTIVKSDIKCSCNVLPPQSTAAPVSVWFFTWGVEFREKEIRELKWGAKVSLQTHSSSYQWHYSMQTALGNTGQSAVTVHGRHYLTNMFAVFAKSHVLEGSEFPYFKWGKPEGRDRWAWGSLDSFCRTERFQPSGI